VILPGATLGMLGGGQLGRMFVLQARTMGYRVMVLDPDPRSPAKELALVKTRGGQLCGEPFVKYKLCDAILINPQPKKNETSTLLRHSKRPECMKTRGAANQLRITSILVSNNLLYLFIINNVN
jgi:hypothetical protein